MITSPRRPQLMAASANPAGEAGTSGYRSSSGKAAVTRRRARRLLVGDCDSRPPFAGPPIPSKHDHALPGQGHTERRRDSRSPAAASPYKAVMSWPPTATLLQLVPSSSSRGYGRWWLLRHESDSPVRLLVAADWAARKHPATTVRPGRAAGAAGPRGRGAWHLLTSPRSACGADSPAFVCEQVRSVGVPVPRVWRDEQVSSQPGSGPAFDGLQQFQVDESAMVTGPRMRLRPARSRRPRHVWK